MNENNQPEQKRLRLSWKKKLLYSVIGLCVAYGITYFVWLSIEKRRFDRVYQHIEKLRPEIEPFFTEEENAPGNGAVYLRKLINTPGLKELDSNTLTMTKEISEYLIEIEKWLNDHPGLIKETARAKEYSHFRFKRDIEQCHWMLMPELAGLRRFIRVQSLMLAELARRNRYDEYLIQFENLLHLMENYDEPVLISGLVIMACYARFIDRFNSSLLYVDKPDVLDKLLEIFSKEPISIEYMSHVMQGELCIYGISLRKHNLRQILLVDELGETTFLGKCSFFLFDRVFTPFVWRMKTNALKYRIESLPITEASFKELNNWSSKIITEKKTRGLSNMLLRVTIPAIYASRIESFKVNCKASCLRAVIRVHKYYLEKGKLPDSLADIEYYKKNGIPKDPRLGLPLLYKKIDNPLCFRIKEVGEDGKDSGGWLKPAVNYKTGKLEHQRFGWVQSECPPYLKVEENIYGIDYYLIEEKKQEEKK